MSVSVQGPPIKVEAVRAFLTQGKDTHERLIIGDDDGLGDPRLAS